MVGQKRENPNYDYKLNKGLQKPETFFLLNLLFKAGIVVMVEQCLLYIKHMNF